jgi:hypothetical protein
MLTRILLPTLFAILLLGLGFSSYWAYTDLEYKISAAEESSKRTQKNVASLLDQIEIKVESSIGKLPFVSLTIDSNHRITRTVIESEFAKNLTWHIIRDGKQVLGRNAQNETSYQYFDNSPGQYTVYVTAFIDGSSRVISNVIFYNITE